MARLGSLFLIADPSLSGTRLYDPWDIRPYKNPERGVPPSPEQGQPRTERVQRSGERQVMFRNNDPLTRSSRRRDPQPLLASTCFTAP
ncbi:hypothetical protein NHX12_021330 [Muraenolepis orangiensis]|uniref:Uncharacterized protein n=1 Tax=Muraenolepis orangiensis TaxID=630683 RepID=A0A9Q0EQ85_9TELE|nr:hypothetical protein NHX12_021330 [Muraenolepis orangiensis]